MRKLLSTTTLLVVFIIAAMAAPRPTNRQLIEIYIAQHKDLAIFEHVLFGIPASITLAQALLESENGLSTLARHGNNHFGIKCANNDCGNVIYRHDDDRDPRTGKLIKSAFRTFATVSDSYRAHSLVLKAKRYGKLFNYERTDYVNWAKGLQECGYATNPAYANLLISLVRQYNLDQYDLPEVLDFNFAENFDTPTTENDTPQYEIENKESGERSTHVESPKRSFEDEPRLTDNSHSETSENTKAPIHADKKETFSYTFYEFTGEPSAKAIEQSKPKSKTKPKKLRP